MAISTTCLCENVEMSPESRNYNDLALSFTLPKRS